MMDQLYRTYSEPLAYRFYSNQNSVVYQVETATGILLSRQTFTLEQFREFAAVVAKALEIAELKAAMEALQTIVDDLEVKSE